jgi:hypothetical protein
VTILENGHQNLMRAFRFVDAASPPTASQASAAPRGQDDG